MKARILGLYLCLQYGQALSTTATNRLVKWKVESSSTEPVTNSFEKWFLIDENVPAAVITSSEAITSVEQIGADLYKANVAVGSFPMVQLVPQMTFECARQSDNTIIIQLKDQEMEVTGPDWARRIVLAASQFMETSSSSRFSLKDNQITCDSVVETSFVLPKWIPIPVSVVQKSGLTSIQKQVDADIQSMLSTLVQEGSAAADP